MACGGLGFSWLRLASVGFSWLHSLIWDIYIYISGMFCLDLSSGILCFLLSRPSFGKETRKEGRKEERQKERKKGSGGVVSNLVEVDAIPM